MIEAKFKKNKIFVYDEKKIIGRCLIDINRNDWNLYEEIQINPNYDLREVSKLIFDCLIENARKEKAIIESHIELATEYLKQKEKDILDVIIQYKNESDGAAAYHNGKLVGECRVYKEKELWSIVRLNIDDNYGYTVNKAELFSVICKEARKEFVKIDLLESKSKQFIEPNYYFENDSVFAGLIYDGPFEVKYKNSKLIREFHKDGIKYELTEKICIDDLRIIEFVNVSSNELEFVFIHLPYFNENFDSIGEYYKKTRNAKTVVAGIEDITPHMWMWCGTPYLKYEGRVEFGKFIDISTVLRGENTFENLVFTCITTKIGNLISNTGIELQEFKKGFLSE